MRRAKKRRVYLRHDHWHSQPREAADDLLTRCNHTPSVRLFYNVRPGTVGLPDVVLRKSREYHEAEP